jgi:hypothetical protein
VDLAGKLLAAGTLGSHLGALIAIETPFVEGALRDGWQKLSPCLLEGGARFLEGLGYAGLVLARMQARVKSAGPSPLFGVDWDAGALADRADVDVAEIDVPRLLAGIVAAAAGEGGHGADKSARRGRRRIRKIW